MLRTVATQGKKHSVCISTIHNAQEYLENDKASASTMYEQSIASLLNGRKKKKKETQKSYMCVILRS